MAEDDLTAIGPLRQRLSDLERAVAALDRRIDEYASALRELGRRVTALEAQRPVVRPPNRGTGALGDPELQPQPPTEPAKDGD